MRKTILLLLSFLLLHFLQAQPLNFSGFKRKYVPDVKSTYYKLGNSVVELKTFQYGETNGLVMVNLHDDENSSVAAAMKFLETYGGLLVKIKNENKRNISFQLFNRSYEFDPNRIFSREGIKQTLGTSGNDTVVNEVEKLANRIIQLIPKNPSCIIALHNNRENEFSITSYMPGNERGTDAKKLHANPNQDVDDLFLTTDSLLYFQLASTKYNSIWQDNENAYNDGSLSIYCGKNGLRYVNCETQHGNDEKYLQMIMKVVGYIEKVSPGAILYSCKWTMPGKVHTWVSQDIYFGKKIVGIVKSVNTDSSGNFCGKLEIKKSFPLYANNDFFLIQYPIDNSKIEARIDPTREKKLLDPRNIININVK